jgi:mono/diheme cytochrome c family protein
MNRNALLAAAAIAVACVAGLAIGQTASAGPAPSGSDPVPALLKQPAAVARGKAIFVGTCGAYCHKMTNVQADAPFLFDCDWLHGGSDEQIFHTITHGVPGTRMVAFGGAIPDNDIWSIVAYLKSASQCKK